MLFDFESTVLICFDLKILSSSMYDTNLDDFFGILYLYSTIVHNAEQYLI